MAGKSIAQFEPRRTPVQTRSSATVDAITEAAVQVLLTHGKDRLTTTRVARRAGVSVGSLYQYYPNKQSLLLSVLEKHLIRVAEAIESVCARHRDLPLAEMIAPLVTSFINVKLERADISMALYAISVELDATIFLRTIGKRSRAAVVSMLSSASDAHFEELPFVADMLLSTMAGTTRSVLEAGAPRKMVSTLRRQLQLLCSAYLLSAATFQQKTSG